MSCKSIMYCTPLKRERSVLSSDSSSENSPDSKRPHINSPAEIDKLLCFSSTVEMETEHDEMPPWADKMWEKLCSVEKKIDDVIASQSILEGMIKTAEKKADCASKMVSELENKVCYLTQENDTLKRSLLEHEAYSKKYNLKFFNIREEHDEDSQKLISKFHGIFNIMGLDLTRIYIDNIHRLPSQGKGPRPVIMKFISYLDRDLVWRHRGKLQDAGSQVTIQEHYPKEMEDNIRKLLPIRKAAKLQGMRPKMVNDKLIINSQAYTVKTLNQLPDSLKPETVSMRREGTYTFFFSEASPLSNWYPCTFKVDGQTYNSSEQYIMVEKARLFGDRETADKVLKASTPKECKMLGKEVTGYTEQVWQTRAPEIARIGIEQKFKQNKKLSDFLTKTGDSTLVEASKVDHFWGIGVHLYDRNIMNKQSSWGKNVQGKTLMAVRTSLTKN